MKKWICAFLCLSVVAGLVTVDAEASTGSRWNTTAALKEGESSLPAARDADVQEPSSSSKPADEEPTIEPEQTSDPATAQPVPTETPVVDTKSVETAAPTFTGNKIVNDESAFTVSDNAGGKTCTITGYTGDIGVTTVYIPKQIQKKTVTVVADAVFVNCPFLKNVVVKGNPEFQGNDIFPAGVEMWGTTGGKAASYAALKAMVFHPLEGPAKISIKRTSSLKKATVVWNAVSGASSYNLYRKQGKGKYALCKNLTAVSYANAGLKPGVKYTYKVNPVFITVNGDKIEGFASKETVAEMTPLKLKKVSAAGIPGGIQVRCKRDKHANGYQVFMKVYVQGFKTGFDRVKTVNSNKTTGYRCRMLVRGMKYSYRVRSFVKVNGKKIYSPYVTVTTRAK